MSYNPYSYDDVEPDDKSPKFGNCPLTRVTPGGYLLPVSYKQYLPRIYKLEIDEDDIWQVGLPKTGTTWIAELIWGVYHKADLSKAKSTYPLQRWMFAEYNGVIDASHYGRDKNEIQDLNSSNPEYYYTCDTIQRIIDSKPPRFIRTHLPLSLLPPQLLDTCKVIYNVRNLKDVWVSAYHFFEQSFLTSHSSVADLAEEYLQDTANNSPVCSHIKEAWQKRHHPNMFFLFYEDMIKDLGGVIRKMSEFLRKDLSDEQVEILKHHLSFESMKNNDYANNSDLKKFNLLGEKSEFIRKGISGDWKNYFDDELLKRYDVWWQKHMGKCDLIFPDV